MSYGSLSVPPRRNRRPTGFAPSSNLRANASLTIATFGALDDVGVREVPAGQERHADRLEVTGRDLVVVRALPRLGRLQMALDVDARAGVAVRDQRHARRRDRRDAGDRREPREHLLEQLLRTRHGVAVALRSQAERDDVIDRDAEIDAADVEQALAEESRAGEQAHRERNLHDDERRPEVRRRSRARRLPGLPLERRRQIRTRRVKRREDAEEHARGHRDPGGKEQHLPGEARRGRIDRAERQIGRHDADRPAEHHEPRDAAQRREQTRLEQQLAYELTAARANREPHGHLRRAAGGAREQQVRDVGARDEQDDQRDDLENRERRAGLREDVTLSATPVRQRHALGRELRLLRVGEPLLQRQLLLDEIGVGHVDAGARGLHRHTGLETREEIRPSSSDGLRNR